MKKVKPIEKEASSDDSVINNLRSQLHFSSETGEIWLHEHRMLLVHADSHSKLRRELIEILGEEALDEAAANEIIMGARAHWFDGEDAAAAGEAQEDGHA